MGCSSSALNKAGDSSRFRSGGEQVPHSGPTPARGTTSGGVCVLLPQDAEGVALAQPCQQGASSFPEEKSAGTGVSIRVGCVCYRTPGAKSWELPYPAGTRFHGAKLLS